MFEWISSPEAWIALVTLTSFEIVLGIGNIIFFQFLWADYLRIREIRGEQLD